MLNQMLRRVCLWLLPLVILGCSESKLSGDPVEKIDDSSNIYAFEQGWNKDTQLKTYHISFGSRLFPYSWMLHLEQADNSEELLSDSHMESLGFLIGVENQYNPNKLPIGFTKDIDEDGLAWMGLGCAACHTGELRFAGKRFRVDGGPGLIDFSSFEAAVLDAMEATINDQSKFQRFAVRAAAVGIQADAMKTEMQRQYSVVKARQQTNYTPVPYGYGRLDAFGQIFNAVATNILEIPENKRVPNAPVSFPALWDAPHFDLVQWNGSAPNSGPGPLIQNITTALAVYGSATVVGSNSKTHYNSSVNIKNLGDIQNLVYQLKSPQWPTQHFGALDPDKVVYGQSVYEKNCLSCHSLVDRDDEKRKIKVNLTDLEIVGTDPQMVENFINAKSSSGVIEGEKLMMFAGDKIDDVEPTIDLVAHVAVGVALDQLFDSISSFIKGYHSVDSAAINLTPRYYKGRPLDGMWASAPFLHNGSVPNLYELLLPVDQRSKTFYVGSKEFDPIVVGFDTKAKINTSLFDTSLLGNSNVGHEFGVDLSAEDKDSLLIYLKSI
jgi:hypothetical protein